MASPIVKTKEQFIEALKGNLRARFRLPITDEHIAMATSGDNGRCPIVIAGTQALKDDFGLTVKYAKVDRYTDDRVDRVNGEPQWRFRIGEFPECRWAIPLPELGGLWYDDLDENFTADPVTLVFNLGTARVVPETTKLSYTRYAQRKETKLVRDPGKMVDRV